MRRLLPVLVGIVIVAGGLFLLLTIFQGRDSAELDSAKTAAGPGTLEESPGDPPTSGTPGDGNLTREGKVEDPELLHALEIGDVALVYGTPKPPVGLDQVRQDAAGPFDPELAAAGQIVFLVRRPGTEGIQALAWKRRYKTTNAQDPELRAFIDAWLGKGRGNTE